MADNAAHLVDRVISRTQLLPENGALLGDLSCPDQRTTEGGTRRLRMNSRFCSDTYFRYGRRCP
jgi:hypothetical protein